MLKLFVQQSLDAYDYRHSDHEKFLDFECDTGLDITLHPGFMIEIDVANTDVTSLSQGFNGSFPANDPLQQAQATETQFRTAGADQRQPKLGFWRTYFSPMLIWRGWSCLGPLASLSKKKAVVINLAFSLMDAFALASVALDKPQNSPTRTSPSNVAVYNIFVTGENGVRILVRENPSATMCSALVSSANHGAQVQGLARVYEAVPVYT